MVRLKGWRSLMVASAMVAVLVGLSVHAAAASAANASCVQYGYKCPPDLPMTGYVLIPIAGLGLVLLAAGLIGWRRSA